MRGDTVDRERLGWITSWPLVLLILVLAFLSIPMGLRRAFIRGELTSDEKSAAA